MCKLQHANTSRLSYPRLSSARYIASSHYIRLREIETLIIENENYEAQLQSANSAPKTNYFHPAHEKWAKQLGTPNVHVSPALLASTGRTARSRDRPYVFEFCFRL